MLLALKLRPAIDSYGHHTPHKHHTPQQPQSVTNVTTVTTVTAVTTVTTLLSLHCHHTVATPLSLHCHSCHHITVTTSLSPHQLLPYQCHHCHYGCTTVACQSIISFTMVSNSELLMVRTEREKNSRNSFLSICASPLRRA